MRAFKDQLIGAGFAFFKATGLHARLSALTRGRGAILMLHHVRPFASGAFAPNRLLEIEPAFFEAALGRIRALGFDFVSLDEATRRIKADDARPFVALTFDDGYKDTLDIATLILERHDAPFAVFVTPGFAERRARLWWVELEEAIRALDVVSVDLDGTRLSLPCGGLSAKQTAFRTLYWMLRDGPEDRLLAVVAQLATAAGIDAAAIPQRLCLDWDGVGRLSRHPLCTIGAHTMTHPRLAKLTEATARHEMSESRRAIEVQIGLPVRHFAYPVGDVSSAGPREYGLAADLGFASAVTTRPGMIFAEHRTTMSALPRLSINGNWQNLDSLEVLLSGVPFALWNRGRRVVA